MVVLYGLKNARPVVKCCYCYAHKACEYATKYELHGIGYIRVYDSICFALFIRVTRDL